MTDSSPIHESLRQTMLPKAQAATRARIGREGGGSLDRLQAVDVAFRRAVAPLQCQFDRLVAAPLGDRGDPAAAPEDSEMNSESTR